MVFYQKIMSYFQGLSQRIEDESCLIFAQNFLLPQSLEMSQLSNSWQVIFVLTIYSMLKNNSDSAYL